MGSGGRTQRLHAVDWLRGIVMVLMALDHVRDYFGGFVVDPHDFERPALFLTRWVTHFCAPVFVLLAGTSAWLYGAGRSRGRLARFLASRGAWLVFLEMTLVYYVWMGEFGPVPLFFQVIAAIGVAMMVLALLVPLPHGAILAIGLTIVLGHNALDPVVPADLGAAAGLWRVLHEGSTADGFHPVAIGSLRFLIIYPCLPWIGVMAVGYGLGPLFHLERARRRRCFIALGALVTALFFGLRWLGGYGNPQPWSDQGESVATALSFLHALKYPPSLVYLCMTLGPALLVLAWLDDERGPRGVIGRALVDFGRVPLFFYVAHIFAAHQGARLYNLFAYGEAYSPLAGIFQGRTVEGYGMLPVPVIWGIWLGLVVALYPVCRGYAERKARGRSAIWSYL